VRRGIPEDERIRLAQDLALERLTLRHADRLLNDGPSGMEGLAAQTRLRIGRGARGA
jgi:hypothetical protein